jgi:O-antigen ligase
VEAKKAINKDKIIGYSVCLFGVFPLLPENLKGLPVILLFGLSLFYFFESKEKYFDYKGFLIQSSLYLVSALSIFYTASFYFPKNKMETALALLIVPLAFSFLKGNSIKKNYKTLFLKTFIVSTAVLSLFSLIYYHINGLFTPETFKVNSFRDLITKIPIICDHPIYVSIYLGLSVLFLMYLFKSCSKNQKVLFIGLSLLNVIHLFILSSKGVIIAMIFAFIIQVFMSIKSKLYKILLPIGIIGVFVISIIYFPNMERRFREFRIKTTYTELHTTNSSSIRIAIYKCAVEQIKNKPLLGYGWGQGDLVLRECYKDISDYLYQRKFNSHNQYLGYYLDGGIIALFVLIGFLLLQIKFAYKYKNALFLSAIVYFSIIMLFENILFRQSGIIMFIFLVMFFRDLKQKNQLVNIAH